MADYAVELSHVTKRFGPVLAVDDVSLSVHDGEFFSLLGPSGCGKTTSVRLIAGFELPSDGGVYIGGKPLLRPSNTWDTHLTSPMKKS
jgi:spermidine/putrescine transport system ATP-binding protein